MTQGHPPDGVADIYARSLLDLAERSHVVDAVKEDVEGLAAVLSREPCVVGFLASPYFGQRAKADLLRKAFEGRVSELTFHFLMVVAEHGREAVLPGMVERFLGLWKTRKGWHAVRVTVAADPGPERLRTLEADLEAALDGRVELHVEVDPAILGGVMIRYGDTQVDNSVKGRLQRAVTHMTHPIKRHRLT